MSSFVENCGVTFPRGYKAAGVMAHIKYENRRDFALVVSDCVANVAGVFTTNAIAAAPVRYDREVVGRGKLRAIAVNTGFANACTGLLGEENVRLTAKCVGEALGVNPAEVAVCSTGVIGVNLPMERIYGAVKIAVPALSYDASEDAAKAIMTTDTVRKMAAYSFVVSGKEVRIGGMSKGAGMIEPFMATMLGFVTTDADISPEDLDLAVREAANVSFNRIVIDNDKSTNDSLFLVANGMSGVKLSRSSAAWGEFVSGVKAVCLSLAKQMVMDGEGVSKFVTLSVTGARDDGDAERAARSIARSMLVKTSWYGMDPNWGRVIAATGYSGAAVLEEKVRISYGEVVAFDRGRVVADPDTLAKMKEVMRRREFCVTVDLGLGDGSCTLYTSDLTHEYVNINADYTT